METANVILADMCSETSVRQVAKTAEGLLVEKRWGVLLEGHQFDLLDWAEGLNSSFDPIVEKRMVRDEEAFVLYSKQFVEADDAQTVRHAADPMILAINGAMAILKGAGQVRIKGIADFLADEPKIHVFAQGAIMMGRSRMSATAQVLNADGSPVPAPPPQASATQEWIDLSCRSDHVADLLTYASRADNWFDVYKMIEAASALAGNEPALVKLCGAEVKAAKRRANEARHHRVSEKGEPLSFDHTRAIAFRAANIVLARAASAAPPLAPSTSQSSQ